MPTDKDRSWTSLYKGAMLEFDPQRLRERISLANNAIKQRLARQLHFGTNTRYEVSFQRLGSQVRIEVYLGR
jgi:hypothetical protein